MILEDIVLLIVGFTLGLMYSYGYYIHLILKGLIEVKNK